PFVAVNGRCIEPNLMTFDEAQFSNSNGDLNDGYFGLDWPTGRKTIYFNKYSFSKYPGMAQGVLSPPNRLINNSYDVPMYIGSDGFIHVI
ncbi:hypothetical protein HDV02_003398, partial [Globomyces sp. JEL0801]